ncbi:MAG TPA: hypothetical protein VKM94_09620 [Blastocatellia bacterium]|nr:hypothetical protein [Blastocatellia bacterium]
MGFRSRRQGPLKPFNKEQFADYAKPANGSGNCVDRPVSPLPGPGYGDDAGRRSAGAVLITSKPYWASASDAEDQQPSASHSRR